MSISDTVGTALMQKYILRDIFTSLATSALFQKKVAGYMGFRATTCFKLVVNSNRFQQGRYLLTWVPTGGAYPVSDWQIAHSANLMQRSQLPHVEYDVNTATSAELKIPYLSMTPYYSINPFDYYTDVGVLQLWAYSPLVAVSGSTIASYTIYAWFEDVELVTPAVPQSGKKVVVRRKNKKTEDIIQAREEEQSIERITPIAHALRVASKSIDTMGMIPQLLPFTEPLSWAAGIGADIASYFGWSSPNNLGPVDRTKIDPAFGWSNSDSVRMPHKLSVTLESSVSNFPQLSLNCEDELSIESFVNRYSFLDSFTFSTSNAIGDAIYTKLLSPRTFYNTYVDGNLVRQHTPVSFVANHFQLYKLDIRFKIKIVKTEFHSGRLLFAFFPYNTYNSPPSIDMNSTAYLERTIVDIREGTEIEFLCPFRSIYPFLNTAYGYGYFFVYVLDPLVAPATVSSSISFLVEVSGKNANFQDPGVDLPFIPCQASIFQSGEVGVPKQKIVDAMLGKETNITVSVNESCVGEKVLSFRQLLKRYVQIPYPTTFNLGQQLAFNPFVTMVSPPVTGVAGENIPPGSGDLYSALSSMFTFYKGGMRLGLQITSGSATSITIFKTFGIGNGVVDAAVPPVGNIDYYTNLYSRTAINTGAFIEVEVPQYNNAYARPCLATVYSPGGSGYPSITPQQGRSGNFPLTLITKNFASPTNAQIFRSITDDGNFSTFVSIPYTVNSLIAVQGYYAGTQ